MRTLDVGGSPAGTRASSRTGHPSIMDNAGGVDNAGGSPHPHAHGQAVCALLDIPKLSTMRTLAAGGSPVGQRRGSLDLPAGTGSGGGACGGGLCPGEGSAAAGELMKEQLQRLTGGGPGSSPLRSSSPTGSPHFGSPAGSPHRDTPRRGSIDNTAGGGGIGGAGARSRRSLEVSRLPVYGGMVPDAYATHAGGGIMGAMPSVQAYAGAGVAVERSARSVGRRSLEVSRRVYEDVHEGRMADAAQLGTGGGTVLPAVSRIPAGGQRKPAGGSGLLVKLGLERSGAE
jgi:hypothetical protein